MPDHEMFPEGPNAQNDGWEVAGSKKKKAEAQAAGQSYSALTGPYVANANFTKPSERAPPPAAAKAEAKAEKPAPPSAEESKAAEDASKPKLLDAKGLTKKLENLLNEFLSVRDLKEVLLSLEEFSNTGQVADKAAMGTQLAKMVLELVMSKSNEKDSELLNGLMVAMATGGHCTWADLSAPLMETYSMMDDIAIDVPMAPKLMAAAVAAFIIDGGFKMEFIKEAWCVPAHPFELLFLVWRRLVSTAARTLHSSTSTTRRSFLGGDLYDPGPRNTAQQRQPSSNKRAPMHTAVLNDGSHSSIWVC
jgi:translation initiation factor 4G